MEREIKTAARWWADLLQNAGAPKSLLGIFEREIAEELKVRYEEDGEGAWIEYGYVPDDGLLRRAQASGINLRGKEESLQHRYMLVRPGRVSVRVGIEGLNTPEGEEIPLLDL